jgi:hypothetical protein
MPTPEEILIGLREIANDWRLLAILWHGYFAVLVVTLILGVRPARRIAGLILVLPFFSVSALAWTSANPFNATFFSLLGVVLLLISFRLPGEKIRIAPVWAVIIGALMFAFGWAYPHFLETASFIPYLLSAPTGLVPCPTLSVVIGVSIIWGGLGSRIWSVVLAVTGIFYGVFGAIILQVPLDWVLLIGSLVSIFTVFRETNMERSNAMG